MKIASRLDRELKYWRRMLGAGRVITRIKPDSDVTVADVLENAVDAHSDSAAIEFESRVWTYRELDRQANRVANWGRALGLKRGDVVALFLEARPEFIAAWFGLAKLGVVSAWVNCQLEGQSLAHCVRVAKPRAIIVGAELEAIWSRLEQSPIEAKAVWFWSDAEIAAHGEQSLDLDLAGVSDERPPRAVRQGMKTKDVAFYIYTSGTTGFPKAAVVIGVKALALLQTFGAVLNVGADDKIYISLPLYHASGGLSGVGAALTRGAALVLRRKFSARAFWEDIVRHGVTLFIYIGELGRYLINAPIVELERQHRVRACFGSGMRIDTWRAFIERFGIEDVIEFYGATEGNFGLINFDATPGAVGRIPPYTPGLIPGKIVRFDVERGEPYRDPKGRCVVASIDEVGEAIAPISNKDVRLRFEGYADDAAQSDRKVLRDVFNAGDIWYRTGDLLRRDRDGYFYFVDRVGDTFRWKGENVATSEVALVLCDVPGVLEANVYGVEVPGHEGRAGMAALVVGDDFSFAQLSKRLADNLPAYARPIFIRLCQGFDTTGTLKHVKAAWAAHGFDLDRVADPLFYFDADKGEYAELDRSAWLRLRDLEMRL